MRALRVVGRLAALSVVLWGCDVYDSSLLGPQGGGGVGAGSNNGGAGGGGGGSGGSVVTACETPADCEGTDNECGTRTCEAGLCGVDAVAAGTSVADQTAGDCLENVCDGTGNVTSEADDSDIEDDNLDCTTDSCSAGAPQHMPKNLGVSCTGSGAAQVCNALGICVECVDGGDCPLSGLCTDTFTCAAPTCIDNLQGPGETDVDCGGLSCPGCENGLDCLVATDCISMACSGNPLKCQPSCIDGELNQGESGIDCGGPCSPCLVGGDCDDPTDCVSGICGGGTCSEYKLLISEARARGPMAGADDFVELYNPLNVAVTLPTDLQIASRSDSATLYSVKWSGAGEVMGAHRHYLIAGGAYSGTATPDHQDSGGLLTDKVSILLRRGAVVIDAFCMHFGANPFDAGYTCEGAPFVYSGGSSNIDRSFERLPGGTPGNGTDTNDNLADFQLLMPSTPQNLQSAATP